MSNKQRLVLSIIDFLNQSIQDGTVKQDDAESLEVAIQCIGEAFDVDPSNETQKEQLSVKPATLPSIFDVFLKTRSKMAPATTSSEAAPEASSSTVDPKSTSAEDKAAAEKLKNTGNGHMSSKQYDAAIEAYTKAIELDPTNAVLYSNRAAAYSSKNEHTTAVADAEKALELDPAYIRAYHRLGHAQYCLNDFKAAADAFQRGLDLDPTNSNLKSGLQSAQTRIPKDDVDVPDENVELRGAPGAAPNMADMLRGLGGLGGLGGGGGGGMPDLASIMNNPMMMQMAQQMMANGGLEQLMSNPNIANMMDRAQSGGLPPMSELLADPTIRNLASQFGAGPRP